MKFRGKVAVWWYLIIVILNVALIGMIVKYGLHYISYFYILPAGLLDLYLIPVCFANYVELDKKKIFIRFGFSREEVLSGRYYCNAQSGQVYPVLLCVCGCRSSGLQE